MGPDHYYTRTYMMEDSNPVIPEGNNVQAGEEAPAEVINPEEGQVFYLTANSASGSKYYGKNGSLGTGWPDYVAVQDQSNRTSITNVTVSENEFRVDTYYTDQDDLELMDSFTIKKKDAPVITVPTEKGQKTELKIGQAFNPMTGVSASDCDGNDLTERVFVTVYKTDGENEAQVQYVDTSAEGSYRIVYEVTDAYGSSAQAEQLVTVAASGGTTDPEDPDNPGSTTDPDNPGSTTDPDNPGNLGGTAGSGDQSGAGTVDGGQKPVVQTGDNALPTALYLAVMSGAAAAGILIIRRGRERK